MDIALLVVRLLLACVFAVAAVAKLADRDGSRKAMTDFGLPPSLGGPLALLLPLAEIAVAALLIPRVTAWWGGLGALALLSAFCAAIGFNLARGRRPDCHCFGSLHSAPAGPGTLIRNLLFALGAGIVVWWGHNDPGLSAAAWAGDLTTTQLAAVIFAAALTAALFAEGWVIVHLIRQQGRLLLRLDLLEVRLDAGGVAALPGPSSPAVGLPPGSRAPAFSLPLLGGGSATLDDLREGGQPVLLVFTDPNCGPCSALLPELAYWQQRHADKLTIALVSRGTPKANRAKTDAYGLKNVLIQQEQEVATQYQSPGTPSAVLVEPDGTVGTHLATGTQAIIELVAHVTGAAVPIPLPLAPGNGRHRGRHQGPEPADGLRLGEAAPPLSFPDLDGRTVVLADFKGRETLVLFWNPACGFCSRMLPGLREWEAERASGAPELLVISTGTEEANRSMGLRSTVVLDQAFLGGSAFGVQGTPSAVLVDAEGRIASPVAVGEQAIFTLAGNSLSKVGA